MCHDLNRSTSIPGARMRSMMLIGKLRDRYGKITRDGSHSDKGVDGTGNGSLSDVVRLGARGEIPARRCEARTHLARFFSVSNVPLLAALTMRIPAFL